MNPFPASHKPVDFLVVGAGLSGLAFARDVRAAGKTVCVLDKGRGVGGRIATRRLDAGDGNAPRVDHGNAPRVDHGNAPRVDHGNAPRVDHGAQFFTARGPRFQSMVETGLADGSIIEWSRGFPLWKNGAIEIRPPGHPRYACPNGMSEIPKRLARDLDVRTGATVMEVRGDLRTGYHAVCAMSGDEKLTFSGKSLILCLPPEQLLALARPILPSETIAQLEAVTFDPAWTLIARLESDLPGAAFPALEFENHPVLGWLSRDHTKRPGPNPPPVLVVHGSGKWSKAHLEDDPSEVKAALLAALADVFGPLPPVVSAQTHRWRYANPTHPLGTPFFWDKETRIGGGGDWAGRAAVEGALTSGWELAKSVL